MRDRKDKSGRTLPFGWYEKEVVRMIAEYYRQHPETSPPKATVLFTYLVCTIIASDQGSDRFIASRQKLSFYTGMSEVTIHRALEVLVRIPAIRRFQSAGRQSNEFELLNASSLQPINNERVEPINNERVENHHQRRRPQYMGGSLLTHKPINNERVEPSVSLFREGTLLEEKERERYAGKDKLLPVQIVTFRTITGFLPPKILWEKISKTLGKNSAEDILPYFAEWVERGHNKNNLAWLFEWFVNREIPAKKYSRSSIRHSDEPTDDWRSEPGAEERTRRAKENADKRAEEEKKAAAEKTRRSK